MCHAEHVDTLSNSPSFAVIWRAMISLLRILVLLLYEASLRLSDYDFVCL